jgi:cytochrome c-type biogenesis protein CcmH/NrfG
MNTTTNDSQLLAFCQKAMMQGNYDKAIEYTNQMANRTVAIKAHLLVIEHEAVTAKAKKSAS